jgi:hypothetical protein
MARARRAWHAFVRTHSVLVLPYAAGYNHTTPPIPHMDLDRNPASLVETGCASALPSVVTTLSSPFAYSGTCRLDLASCRPHLRTLRAGQAWRVLAYRDTDTLRGPPNVTPAEGARKVHTADPLGSGGTPCLPCVVVYASHRMSSRACAYLHAAPEKTMRA